MMPFPRKMKTNVSVILLTALALLMSTSFFKEGPFFLVAASPANQPNGNVPTPPRPHKSSNVPSALKAAPQPNPHVPTPPHQRNVHSSVGLWAARAVPGCPPASPQCPRNAPSRPGCCPSDSKEQQQLKVNGKAEFLRNYESSIDAGKHAPADHISIAVEGRRFDDSQAVHTQSFKSSRKLIGSSF